MAQSIHLPDVAQPPSSVLKRITGTNAGLKEQPRDSRPPTAAELREAAIEQPTVAELAPGPIADRIRKQAADEGILPVVTVPTPSKRFEPRTIIQIPQPISVGGFRAWLIIDIIDGDVGEEDYYVLHPLDKKSGSNFGTNKVREILVPCYVLDTHDQVRTI